jgi:hypothetical protein
MPLVVPGTTGSGPSWGCAFHYPGGEQEKKALDALASGPPPLVVPSVGLGPRLRKHAEDEAARPVKRPVVPFTDWQNTECFSDDDEFPIPIFHRDRLPPGRTAIVVVPRAELEDYLAWWETMYVGYSHSDMGGACSVAIVGYDATSSGGSPPEVGFGAGLTRYCCLRLVDRHGIPAAWFIDDNTVHVMWLPEDGLSFFERLLNERLPTTSKLESFAQGDKSALDGHLASISFGEDLERDIPATNFKSVLTSKLESYFKERQDKRFPSPPPGQPEVTGGAHPGPATSTASASGPASESATRIFGILRAAAASGLDWVSSESIVETFGGRGAVAATSRDAKSLIVEVSSLVGVEAEWGGRDMKFRLADPDLTAPNVMELGNASPPSTRGDASILPPLDWHELWPSRVDFGQQFILVSRAPAALKRAQYHPMFTSCKEDVAFGAYLRAIAGDNCNLQCQAIRVLKREASSDALPPPRCTTSLWKERHTICVTKNKDKLESLASFIQRHCAVMNTLEPQWDRAVCQVLSLYYSKWVKQDRASFLRYFSDSAA